MSLGTVVSFASSTLCEELSVEIEGYLREMLKRSGLWSHVDETSSDLFLESLPKREAHCRLVPIEFYA